MSKLSERRNQILQVLKTSPIATVGDLALTFSVSQETIRKDLTALYEAGQVIRIHGGAALKGDDQSASPYSLRKTINERGKAAIAKAAVELIQPEDSIILESSTTAAALCGELLKRPELLQTLFIVTNSFYLASLLQSGGLCTRLFFLGGWVNPSEHSSHGPATVEMLKQMHVDKAFISAAALSEHFILSSYYEDDKAFQQQAIARSDRAILLADSSKFGNSAVLSVASLSEMDCLVTDIAFSQEHLAELAALPVRVVYAEA